MKFLVIYSASPNYNYTFETYYEGALSETDDQGGVNLSYKFDPNPDLLILDGIPTTGGDTLTKKELKPVVKAAINYWEDQGIDQEQRKLLKKADILIGDLGDTLLAETNGSTITLDDDAAGYGWSDSLDTVQPDEVDLFSAVTHEFGHILGYDHDVMGGESRSRRTSSTT